LLGCFADGFWEKKIGEPFKRQDPCSLPLLHKLIEVTMIRHSKGQVRATCYKHARPCDRWHFLQIPLPPLHIL
jgi:hypothetical protein